jgi:ATP adenylyltransferase
MAMYRTRKDTLRYRKAPTRRLPADDTVHCPFCNVTDRVVYAETKTMRVVANKFPYSFWDNRPVAEHILLTPKRHVISLDELTDAEKTEAIHLMSKYEAQGYNVYWRSQDNHTRSVPHQHTHLIKLRPKDTRFLMYIRRPYLLWKF